MTMGGVWFQFMRVGVGGGEKKEWSCSWKGVGGKTKDDKIGL